MRVLKVEYIEGYKLKILFGDKKTKIVDLREKISRANGIFLPLKDLDYFKQVSLDDCQLSICWPNGADICPDVLYKMGEDVERPLQKRKRSFRVSRLRKKTRAKTLRSPRASA